MPERLSGVIERITFHNESNGYCVLRVKAEGHGDLVTIVGNVNDVVAGEFVNATGEWVTDRQHGEQFKADEIRTAPPHTAEGIAKYLGSKWVKGIGPTYAKKIVDVFGDKTLDVIDQSPSFLSQVKGIGPKRLKLIREGWEEQKHVRGIMVFLTSYGIGTARAIKIFKMYGEQAIEMVKANPYRLSTDIWGIGFQTADELAIKLGLPRDSPHRAQAAVRHVLKQASSDGHVGLPEELAAQLAVELTKGEIDDANAKTAIDALRFEDEIVRDSPILPSAAPAKSSDDSMIFLKPLFLAEVGVARSIAALAVGGHPLPEINVAAALEWVQTKMGITFAESQKAAIRHAVTKKFLVLTGGPGTGKTTIVRAVLEIFQAKQLRVGLCAPTGRAAKRLAESTGREAKTIHRLLEFDPSIGDFRRNRDQPLDFDLLVVDEVSMVDIRLMNQLLRAIPPWACLVLVGDVDQLPSVGPGSVLSDVIASRMVPVARLTEIHRQAGSSDIVRAAHAINQGLEPESAPAGKGDFYFIEANDPARIIERILYLVRERIPERFGLDPFRDVQILTPQVKTELGVINLNKELQAALNPPKPGATEVKRYDTTFRVGDKVMQVQNNYQRDVFNGDIGRVVKLNAVDQIATVEFEGREVEYDFGDLDELQLAYAASIHKSQGSEYPVVVIPLHTQHYVMLQRNLLYTAITRGRKLVVVVGSKKAMWRAVTNAETKTRFSLLTWRLQNMKATPPERNALHDVEITE